MGCSDHGSVLLRVALMSMLGAGAVVNSASGALDRAAPAGDNRTITVKSKQSVPGIRPLNDFFQISQTTERL
jgi:hypothetical protein